MVLPRTATYKVWIDWSGTAGPTSDFAGTYDDVSDAVLGDPGISIQHGRDQARSLSPPMVPSCSFVLTNTDRFYSSENASSPLYQQIRPGRQMRVAAYHGNATAYDDGGAYNEPSYYDGAASHTLFRGYVDRFVQGSAWGEQQVQVECLGIFSAYVRHTISIPLQEDIRTDEAVTLALTEAGTTAEGMRIEVGDTLLREWWVDERSLWSVLLELWQSEGAGSAILEDWDGIPHFINRNYLATEPTSTTSQVTLYDHSDGGSTYTDLVYDAAWDQVIDRATVTAKERTLDALAPVWQLSDDLVFAADQSRVFWIRPSDPVKNALVPAAPTDYTVTGGTVAMNLGWADGAVLVLYITATSGTPTVHDLQVRAQPLTVTSETTLEATAPGGASALDARTLNIDAVPGIAFEQAEAITQAAIDRYGNVLPRVTMTLQNDNGDALRRQLTYQPTYRITAVNTHLGMSTDLYIEQVTHTMTAGGLHRTIWGCEAVSDVALSGSQWDVALWDDGTWGL